MYTEINENMLSLLESAGREQGLNNRQLAEKIGVCWLTLHNWQKGTTTRLSARSSRKLNTFLEKSSIESADRDTTSLLKKTANICDLCKGHPKIRSSLFQKMGVLINETLTRYGSAGNTN